MTVHSFPRVAEHEIADIFLKRWSPRAFSGERITDAALGSIFEAARWAPSSSNSQPWRLIYAHRGAPAFERLLATINPRNQRWAKDASVLVLLLSRRTHIPIGGDGPAALRNHSFDAGAAWSHLALQAAHDGWAAHAIGGFDADAARSAFEVPEDHQVEIVVAIGRQTDAGRLPEDLKARETPSGRNKVDAFAREGAFSFD